MDWSSRKPGQRGYVLITAAMFALAFAGALALAVDLGRMYVMKSMVQARADAAALSGAVQLDGTAKGVADADIAARRMAGQSTGVQTAFSIDAAGPWALAAGAPAQSRVVRVRVKAQAALFFMRVLDPAAAGSVGAEATAGQVESPVLKRGATAGECSAARLRSRVAEDSDQESMTYEEYLAAGKGNGRRIVLCPAEGGAGAHFAGLGGDPGQAIGAFVLGSRKRGAAPKGAYVVRLVE